MGFKIPNLLFWLLQLVLVAAVVDSLSTHFIDIVRSPAESQRRWLLSSASETNLKHSTRIPSRVPFVPTVSSTPRRQKQQPPVLFSSRQRYDEADDGYDDFAYSEFDEKSEEEIELRRMSREKRVRPDQRRGSRLARYEDSYEDDEDFYDDDDRDEEEPVAGNFWSNPSNSMDRPPAGIARRGRQRQPRRYYDEDDDVRRQPSRQRRRPAPTTGMGEPPKLFKDFYDQFFWYGFDVDESAEVGDNNIFGGTKGKFNGFNYLLADENEERNERSRSPRLPPSESGNSGAITRRRRRADEIDYYDDNDDDDDIDDRNYYGGDDYTNNRKSLSSSSYTPPTDHTSTRYDTVDEYDDYDEDDDYDDEYAETRSMGRKSSARFNNEDEYKDRRSGGRRRRRQQSSSRAEWSPLNMIESFLGIDREEMDYKADVYNSKMGLGKRRRSSSLSSMEDETSRGPSKRRRVPQRRSARDDPERPGYAYRYDATEDDDESTPILDVDLAYGDEPDSALPESRRRQLSLDVDEETRQPQKKERSWEERQIAMERVPPVDVVAWGPAGELPMSAREKAFMDAQEDIEMARRKLNVMKKKESAAKDEIVILRVDAERQRVKLSESPRERRSRRDVEELRQIELDIDDASRDLRGCRTKVDRARKKLEQLEERHHAIMSCYNIDQASLLVGESLNQISSSIQGATATTVTAGASTPTSGNAIVGDNVAGGEVDSSSSSAPKTEDN